MNTQAAPTGIEKRAESAGSLFSPEWKESTAAISLYASRDGR